MRTYNNMIIAVFGLMAVALFAAGFYNRIHFMGCAMSVILAALAFTENKRDTKKKPS